MVTYLDFKDKKLPIRISYFALTEYKKETGAEFDDKIAGNALQEIDMFEPILYFSLVSGHRAIGEEMKIERHSAEMFEVLEDCFLQFLNILPKYFPNAEQLNEGKKESAPAVGNRSQRRAGAKK